MAKKKIIPENNTPQPTPVIPAAQQEYVDKVTQQNADATAQSAGLQQQTGPDSPANTPPVQAISGTDKQTPAPAPVQVKTAAPALEVVPVSGSLNDPTNPKSPFYGMTQKEINNQLAANDPNFSKIQQSVDSNAPLKSPIYLNVSGANDNPASPTAATATLQSGAGAPLYDPNNPVNVFERYAPRPTPEMDAERQAALRNGAAISDSFAALADMFAHGKGAYVRPRDTTASQAADARIEAGTQKDRERSDAYKNALLNIAMNDYDFRRKSELQNEQLAAKLNNQRAIADAQNQLKFLDLKIQSGHYTNQDLLARDRLTADITDMMQKNSETSRHNKAEEGIGRTNAQTSQFNAQTNRKEYGLKRDQFDYSTTIPVMINQKSHPVDKKYISEVVARAIKDGTAGTIPQQVVDPTTGQKTWTDVPVTQTTKLTPQQEELIFRNNAPRYFRIGDDGSTVLIKQKGAENNSKQNFTLGGVKSR